MDKRKVLSKILPLISIAVIIIFWAVLSLIVGNTFILPSVKDTLSATFSLLGKGEFYFALLGTLLRSLIAFFISALLSFVLAVFSVRSKNFNRAISPVIGIIRALPTIAVILMLLLWTNSKIAPVIVTTLVVFPTLYTDTFNALNGIDKELIETCKVFNVPKKTVLYKVKILAILPDALNIIGAGISLNIKLMVAAEVLAQTTVSIGYYLNTSKLYFEIPTLFALVLITVVIGVAVELSFSKLSAKAGKWR